MDATRRPAWDFSQPPDSRWTVRGPAHDLAALLRRAAEFLDSLGPVAVQSLTLDRDADDVVLTVVFDHWGLPADLDYLDPRVASGYHDDEAPRDDVEFMVALAADFDAHTIVDFGCGTGRLATALAERGRRIIGVDPAKAMLDLARSRETSPLVEWIWGGVDALDARDVDLIVMTGNIPSIYVTDEAWDGLLGALHAALRPGGHLAFGSWNPEARPWEAWGMDAVIVLLDRDKGAHVRAVWSGDDKDTEAGSGERLYAASEWRYRTHEELTESLTRVGFVVEQSYGDWHRSPLTPACPDLVLVARRS